ncbi:MAG: aspartyl protease family protein [bacterium]
MGLFKTKVRVGVLRDAGPVFTEEVSLLVDTGATYSTIPSAVLKRAGVNPIGKLPIRLADGSIVEKTYGGAALEVQGRVVFGNVLFGDEGDLALLGVTSLELGSLAVDPVGRRLVSATSIQA